MAFKKLAVLSNSIPPSTTGQAIVLFNLLKTWDPDRYCLISNHPQEIKVDNQTGSPSPLTLPASFFHVLPGRKFPVPKPRLLSLSFTLFNLVSETFHRARHIKKLLEAEGCTTLVACSGDLINIPAGYIASLRANIDFYVYLFDDYQLQWPTKYQRFFASFMEKVALRRARGIVVPNEFLGEAYQQRHLVNTFLIRNPTTTPPLPPGNKEIDRELPVRIGFTGSLYHAHYDAFHNLLKAMQRLDAVNFQLHIYTPQSPDDLQKQGLTGPVVIHPPITLTESLSIQRSFDILFLPLAFRSEIPGVIKTSSPGKLGEYLSSGTPILVHAPPDSFVSWYCKKYQCGMVVDALDPGQLKEAIHTMSRDRQLRTQLIANAAERAEIDFDLKKNTMKFKEIFSDENATSE